MTKFENADGDIEIKIVGLRPGENPYEELLINDDNPLQNIRNFKDGKIILIGMNFRKA